MQRITYCLACSLPLVKQEDFGGGNPDNRYCVHCCDDDGEFRDPGAIRNEIRAFWTRREKSERSPTELWPDHVVGHIVRLRK